MIGRRARAGRRKTVTMAEFRKQPGEYLLDVRRDGYTIVLTQYGKPVALLAPIPQTK